MTVWGIARANGTCIWRRRCEGEGEGEGEDDARHRRRHRVWRDEASVVRRHRHVWASVEGEVGGGEASSSC